MRNIKKKIFYIIFVVSFAGNGFFFLSNGLFEINRTIEKRQENRKQNVLNSLKDFEKILYEGGLFIIETGNECFTPKKMGGVINNFRYNFKKYPKDELFTTSEMGYLMISVLERAVKENDQKIIGYLKEIFEQYVISREIIIVDQCLYGIVAINLYNLTGEEKYKVYADSMAEWLKTNYISDIGILYRQRSSCNFVDGLGMYIPFLMEYSKFSSDATYETMAINCFDVFCKNGIDPQTGIAFHSYIITEPKIKMGSSNWGRGNAWMALAIICLPKEKLNSEAKMCVERFSETMCAIYNKQGCLRQFINEGELDLSATIPIIYILERDSLMAVDKLSFSKFLRGKRGNILYFSSGPTTSSNDYSPFRGPNMLTQAIMLKWILECK